MLSLYFFESLIPISWFFIFLAFSIWSDLGFHSYVYNNIKNSPTSESQLFKHKVYIFLSVKTILLETSVALKILVNAAVCLIRVSRDTQNIKCYLECCVEVWEDFQAKCVFYWNICLMAFICHDNCMSLVTYLDFSFMSKKF